MSESTIAFASVAAVGLAPAANVLTQGFSGYVVPIAITPTSLLATARSDSVDHTLSAVALRDGLPVGAALVARRGWTVRVAGMAIVPSARRQGVARALMDHLISAARARGDRMMELEVIEQNVPAVSLYEDLGFTRIRRLMGHAGRPTAVPATPDVDRALHEIDVCELARVVTIHGLADLPWQLSASTLVQLGPPCVALRCGSSYALVSDPSAPAIGIRALVTEPEQRRRGHALALLRALFARHPDKEWRTSSIWPEDVARVFARAGLSASAITQWQMKKPLGPC